MKEYLLPHYGERSSPVDMLVLHCSAYAPDKLIGFFDEYKSSSHYIIDVDGEVIKLVDEKKSAYHAGVGYWRGSDASINSRSVGIELVNMSLGQEDYSEKQIEKLIPFCQKIIRKYKIKPENIVGHSDIKPKGKADPGINFPWKRMAKEGIGLWYELKNAAKISEDDPVKLLSFIGYDARDEESAIASAYAFRRRFMRNEVEIDPDIMHLVDNVYPAGRKELLGGEKFLQTLKAVAYSYQHSSERNGGCFQQILKTKAYLY